MRFLRAQSTLEFLAILAVALTVIIVIIALTNEQISDIGRSRQTADVRSAARDLASAANQVYLQGSGARKLVRITLPQGYNASSSFIANKTIKLSFYGSDFIAQTGVDVVGALPASPGTYYLWVIAREGYATIGPQSIIYIPGIIIVSASASSQPQSKTAYLNATNDGNESLNVSLSLAWNETEVNVSFSNPPDQNFGLDAGHSKGIVFTVGINASAIGTYSGYIDANASNGETERIDFLVEVYSPTCAPSNATPGPGGPCPPHKVSIQTFRDSSYLQTQKIFDPSQTVKITSLDWAPTANITLDIKNPLYASVSGFPVNVTANSSGGLSLDWNPAGQSSGTYTVIASNASFSTNSSFQMTSCT